MIDKLNELKKDCDLTDSDIIGDLLQPIDNGMDYVSGDNNYVWLYLIGKYFKPKVIAEMGTRFGYSMKSFIKGAENKLNEYSIWSYDLECGGIKTIDIFKNYFTALGIKDINTFKVDTQYLKDLNIPIRVDLCLVDALHTEEGCYHECSLGFKSLRKGGILLVDDVNFENIKTGAERFCNDNNIKYYYIPSLRGIYIIKK